MKDEIKNQSVYKAFCVLECFSADRQEMTVQELSQMTGLYKSNVFNILSTLKSLGYVLQNTSNKKYYLSSKFARLASIPDSNNNLWKLIPETLQTISLQTGEVSFFAVRRNDEISYLNAAYPNGREPSNALNMTGMSAPMYCTALGKAILANVSQDEVEQYLNRVTFEVRTPTTIHTQDSLREELRQVREQGYAIDNMENAHGIICIAVPVFSVTREILGAISVSGPSLRFSVSTIPRILDIVRKNVWDLESRC
jgi:DNA-binding IclR family transcriptional regulator